ncbi:hypothetical protein AWC38_SpisGene13647 [Stylophora pistillata]|uniref:Uncharacterized protein n=1 Tax=Stylophora pistillata TaxID=50429 RepID=A0A2B4RTU9_STYPI|nr:hypothetical protein AWC38_SpisGene13647 [Stylophora pistillata]
MATSFTSNEQAGEKGVERTRQPSSHVDIEGVTRERMLSLKRSRAGHLGYLNRLYKEAELLMQNPENIREIRAKKKDIEDAFGRCLQSYEEYYQLAVEPGKIAEALNDYYSVMIGRKEFEERLEEWLQTAEKSPNEMLMSSRKEENVDVLERYATLSRADSRSAKFKSSRASSRIEEEIEKAKAIGEFYEGSEYSKSASKEEKKPPHTREAHDPTLSATNPTLPNGKRNQVGRTYLRSELNPTAEPWNPVPTRFAASGEYPIVSQRLQQVLGQQQEALHLMAYSLQQALQMPKTELLTFDGNPLNYRLFIKNLEVNIAKRVPDAESRLTYLIQHCTGKAKEAIKDCSIVFPPEHGYENAQDILHRRFGQKHVIAHAHIEKIVNGPQLKRTDAVGLSDLSVQMQNCALTLVLTGAYITVPSIAYIFYLFDFHAV